MNPTTATVYIGHVLDVLKTLPDESVHCVVTSPPYWGLRDYGLPPTIWDGDPDCDHEWDDFTRPGQTGGHGELSPIQQNRVEPMFGPAQYSVCKKCGAWRGSLGLEPTPEMFVRHLVQIFQEVKRILRHDGTLWLNLGDSYAGDKTGGRNDTDVKGSGRHPMYPGNPDGLRQKQRLHIDHGLKPKDLVGIPWRVAFALQTAGWWLRSDVVWEKMNPIPESVSDRPTKAHEYLFLLSKSQTYYYDIDAIRGGPDPMNGPNKRTVWTIPTESLNMEMCGKCKTVYTAAEYKKLRLASSKYRCQHDIAEGEICGGTEFTHQDGKWICDSCGAVYSDEDLGNLPRSAKCRVCGSDNTWISHFATFPQDLVLPCILAGTSAVGCCLKCGAPLERNVERQVGVQHDSAPDPHYKAVSGGHSNSRHASKIFQQSLSTTRKTVGWNPTCDCPTDTGPCTVLDPFAGSGTTLLVSAKNGRNSIGIDLNADYVKILQKRLSSMETDLVNPTKLIVMESPRG